MTTNTQDTTQHSGREEMIEEIVHEFNEKATGYDDDGWIRGTTMDGDSESFDHKEATDWLRTTLHSLVERVERDARAEGYAAGYKAGSERQGRN